MYAYPEVLVETDWVKRNVNKPGIRIVEIDVDTKAYAAGHIPGAVAFNWQTQLQDQVRRDIISKEVAGFGRNPLKTRSCCMVITITGLRLMDSGFSKSTDTTMCV